MPMRTWLLASAALLLAPDAGQACDLPHNASDAAPIETRKPLRGDDDVRLTSGFGLRHHPLLNITKMHNGIDWAAPRGTPVIAAGGGRVTFAGGKGEYGNTVIIEHGGGWQTFYSQMSRIEVREGDCLASGALIGGVGTTGLSAGPHLHFEVLQGGSPIDPMRVRLRGQPPEADGTK